MDHIIEENQHVFDEVENGLLFLEKSCISREAYGTVEESVEGGLLSELVEFAEKFILDFPEIAGAQEFFCELGGVKSEVLETLESVDDELEAVVL